MKAKVLLMDEDKENLNAQDDQEDEYNPDVVSVIDEDGVEHFFEELDRIENGETYLCPIEVEEEFNEINKIFIERFSDNYLFE